MVEGMGIGKELLDSLAAGGGPEVTIRRPGGRLTLRTSDADRLGVLVTALEIHHVAGRLPARALHRRLEQMADRVVYLTERLSVVEHDPARTGALMRSASPRWTGPDRVYFELRVERNREASFRRYRQPPGSEEREAVPFLLDRTTLARLADDLMSALAA
jgi:hypothetical protein